jgi:splicing factor U2AF 65 kDa subunit
MSLVLGGNAGMAATNPTLAALLGMNAMGGAGAAGLGLGGFGAGGLGSMGFMEPKELRELFVGNTPPGTNELVLLEFLNLAMRHVKLTNRPEGQDPIMTCRMNQKFAFVELRSAEEANRMLSLTNIPFMGALLKIGRPSKYVGPHTPAKTWQQLIAEQSGGGVTAAAPVSSALSVSSMQGPVVDPNTKIYRELFVGNTSPEMSEQAILEFIGGAMEKMGLSSAPGNPVIHCRVSPRFAFIELRTIEETANCINISGIPFMGQSLKLGRPSKYTGPSLPYYEWDDLLSRWMTGELKLQTAGHPSPVIRLTNMVVPADLESCEAHADVVQDTTDECSQYGSVVRVVIPRPGESVSPLAVGKVFVEMESIEQAKAALVALKGRTFDGRIVDAKFFPLDKLLRGDFSDPPPVVVTSKGVTTIEAVIGNQSSLTAAQMSVGGALDAAMSTASAFPGGNGMSTAGTVGHLI